jgi:hypothetical protein
VGEGWLKLHVCPVARSSVVLRERVRESKSAVGRRLIDVPDHNFSIFVTNRPKSGTIVWRDHNGRACERVFYAPRKKKIRVSKSTLHRLRSRLNVTEKERGNLPENPLALGGFAVIWS